MLDQREISNTIAAMSPLDIRIELFKKRNFDFIVKGNKNGIPFEHVKQKEALSILTENKYKEFMFGGAANGAKSWTGCVWLGFMCLAYPGTKWFIARTQLKDLKESVLDTFGKVASTYEFGDYKFNGVDHYIKFPNGSKIIFKEISYKPSDPMYESLGSTEYTGGWIEESGEVDERGAQVISKRAGRHLNDKYGIKKIIFYTCNPKKNWNKTEFYDKWKNGTLEDHKKFLPSLVVDNPFREEGTLEDLESYKYTNIVLYERLFKGNWDYEENPNALCDYEMIEQVFDNDHVEDGQEYITVDVARFGADKARIMVWKGWQVVKQLSFDISKTTEISLAINLLRRKYKIPKNKCIADADGVGCLMPETEVLTTKGWKKAIDINSEDVIVSKNEDGYREEASIFEIIHHDREKFISVNDDLAFTNTHIHFYKTRKEHNFKKAYWDDISELKRIYHDTEAKNKIKDDEDLIFEATTYPMHNGGHDVLDNRVEISEIDFAEFIGWYISEGCLDSWNNKHVVNITQSAKSPHIESIENLLDRIGFSYYKSIAKKGKLFHYQIQHKGLFNWLKENCYTGDVYTCYHKQIPDMFKKSSKSVFMKLCESFIKGDGYYHKGEMQFVSTSKKMIDDFQEGLLFNGILSRIYIKHKKGSKGLIQGREITRTTDCFLLSSIKHPATMSVKSTQTFFGKAINIRIANSTRALLVRNGKDVFWTHNGGVVDETGILSFNNNGKPIKVKGDAQNYRNIQVQCLYALADKVNEGGLWINCDVSSKDMEEIKQELDQIQSSVSDYGKLDVKRKSEIKKDIGRSPDWRDTLLMRAYFDLKPNQKIVHRTKQTLAELGVSW